MNWQVIGLRLGSGYDIYHTKGKLLNNNLLSNKNTLFGKFNYQFFNISMITIISSTNRPGSSTLKLAKIYQQKLKEKGVEAGILSLAQLPDNIIVSDLYNKRSPEFEPIQQIVSNTDKFIFLIPEYNGSFPGVLKVFIDACNFPESFYDKKAALVGLSSGKYGNIRGVDHFTGVCHYLHLNIMALKIHIAAINKEFDEDGNLFKSDTIKFVNEQIDKIISF
ncbi:NAD(P)H-dependent FMN reductase [Mucilaginibacter oryzae]|uniref:NAD(P)H-dependent FMN reductase n=2 Tax=Mucilaginibacter oryzae TaxID=468058 RepID=A0A316H4B1_9SPHI|nr:NAD(P)H-dependent FMN reductase [Mucilaginibacter oryzae]